VTDSDAVPAATAATKRSMPKALKRFTRSFNAMLGLGITVALVIVALLAPLLVREDPYKVDFSKLSRKLEAPNQTAWLGRDNFGRDLYSRIVTGTRVSLVVGFSAVGVGLVVGSLLGLVAGYFGGLVDEAIMRFTDILYAFPSILLALALVAALGPSLGNLVVAIAFVSIPGFARIMRSSVIQVRGTELVESARSLGAGTLRVIFKHVLPNSLAPTVALASTAMAQALLTEAGLSFLGLGVQPPTPTWGGILADGREFLRTAPFMTNFAGLAILLAVVGFNLLGDGIRDALDPRSKL
jgi:peptide/nickel transport system permease protein